MPIDVDIEVRLALEVKKDLERVARELHGTPVVQAFKDATLLVMRDARIDAPVDTGRLRSSITPEVASMGKEVVGIVGSNVAHAPMMELGAKPHFPPISALEVWARRHHADPYLVARAIARKGLAARKFLQNAFEKNKTRIIQLIERAVDEVIK